DRFARRRSEGGRRASRKERGHEKGHEGNERHEGHPRREGLEERDEAGRRRALEQRAREERGVILAALQSAIRDARAATTAFFDDGCPLLAGGIAYPLFFSLIPILPLVVGIL